jgi:excisionase family DNA binding protein
MTGSVEQMLTLAEVAEAARVSKMTVYRRIHDGTLSAARGGRLFRVPLATVQELLGSDLGFESRPTGADVSARSK